MVKFYPHVCLECGIDFNTDRKISKFCKLEHSYIYNKRNKIGHFKLKTPQYPSTVLRTLL